MKLALIIYVLGCLSETGIAEIFGKFIFHGENNGETSLSILHKPPSIGFVPNPGPIPANEISSVLALSLGLSVNKDIKWHGLQGMSLFHHPKAVMMLSIDGVPQEKQFLRKMAFTSFPVNMLDVNIAEMYKISEWSTLGSHVNELFDGKALVRSLSFKEEIATGGFSTGKFSMSSFWSEMSNGWSVIPGNSEMFDSLTNQQILNQLPTILPNAFVYNAEEKTVVVNTNNLQFSFNLQNKIDFNFFSEVTYMMWQYIDILEHTQNAVKDDIPDVYLFSISTFNNMVHYYGSDSKQVKAALLIMETVIPKLVKAFVELYGGDILVVGVETPSNINLLKAHKSDMINALESLKDNEIKHLKDIDTFIPELHVVDEIESTALQSLCKAIQGSVSHLKSFKFECVKNHQRNHIVARRSLLATNYNDTIDPTHVNLGSYYDDTFPAIFNIWLWLIVVLFLALYVISLSLWFMDPGHDSVIYRLTQQRIKSD